MENRNMENRNMENRNMEALVKDLIGEFVDETENEFYEMVYDWYYQNVTESFKDEVAGYCKIVIFGDIYDMNVQEFYDFDRYRAIKTWNDFVNQSLIKGFHDSAKVILCNIEIFAAEFQQWLAKQDSEDVANVAVALMSGEIDLTKIIVDWLRDRLGREDWVYPA